MFPSSHPGLLAGEGGTEPFPSSKFPLGFCGFRVSSLSQVLWWWLTCSF